MKVSIFSLWRAVALVAFVLCAALPASAQGFKWWQDDNFRRELGLTQEQTTRLEAIFQKSLPELRKQKDALDRAQADFDRLVERGDDGSVMDQVGVVEGARAELNKARTLMLLRMRRSLTADQWAKFTALHSAQERERDGRPGADRNR
jgi:Spy/CpxP family protein refolding chaperone